MSIILYNYSSNLSVSLIKENETEGVRLEMLSCTRKILVAFL